jgi:peptidyl-prolyl cis-trans isomerase D
MRTADVVVLSLDTLAATIDVTDEEITAEYERTKESRTAAAEKRTIRQAPLSAEQVAAFEAGKAAGKSFDELVTETGVAVTDLGTLARTEVSTQRSPQPHLASRPATSPSSRASAASAP